MIATEQEMRANKVPPEHRDYCAHLYLELEGCRARELPWITRCVDIKDKLQECLVDE